MRGIKEFGPECAGQVPGFSGAAPVSKGATIRATGGKFAQALAAWVSPLFQQRHRASRVMALKQGSQERKHIRLVLRWIQFQLVTESDGLYVNNITQGRSMGQ